MRERFIGLMSGTSLDGIDGVIIEFEDNGLHLISCHYQPYTSDFRNELKAICSHGIVSLQSLGYLDAGLGILMAACVNSLLEKTGLAAADIRAIGSHGQTIYHCPRAYLPFSLQIGDPNRIAEITGITTVADFRRRDIAAGGQGAPLVPAFHSAIFQEESETRVIVNLGGIANITILPNLPNAPVLGFDTGPGNALMDYWVEKHLNTPFDRHGDWAQSGKLDESLLRLLRADPYFEAPPPKSTGKEYFSSRWLDSNLARIPHPVLPEDVQATLAMLTAATITEAIRRFSPATDRVLVCGGGAHNAYVMDLIRRSMDCRVETTAAVGFDPDYIEAMAFAWLARQTLDGRCANLPSATGASAPVILGGIYPGKRPI